MGERARLSVRAHAREFMCIHTSVGICRSAIFKAAVNASPLLLQPKLLKLKLNDNYLITLPVEAMSQMLNLTLLDVSNNRIRRFYDQFMPWIENGTRLVYQGKHDGAETPA